MNNVFYRIYWSDKFDWKHYALLYNEYCKKNNNYYTLSANFLIDNSNIKNNFLALDLGCGTGALTSSLLKRFPEIKIIAMDISNEVIKCYKKNFKKPIKNKQIKVVKGNAENIDNYIKHKVDFIFIASSLWDMELNSLFKNLSKIMKPETKILANLPSLIVRKNEKVCDCWSIGFGCFGCCSNYREQRDNRKCSYRNGNFSKR